LKLRQNWLRESKLIIVAGKGGVGKTTVSTVTVAAAARLEMKVLLVTIDGGHHALRLLGTHLGTPNLPAVLDYETVSLSEQVDARQITPDHALVEWLRDKSLGRLADRLVKTGALDVIATAAPGIRDILVLGRIKALINEGRYDLIVLDGPASGHAVTFLQSAHGLIESVSVGAIRQQAADVAAMLSNPEITQCVLVTLPETTPVNELIETAFALEDRVGVKLAAVVVNAILDPLGTTLVAAGGAHASSALATYRARRESAQAVELTRLPQELPLPLIQLPFVHLDGADSGLAFDRLVEVFVNAASIDGVE
jgi:anion-transporting  ArsA/GET3 family ATPase